MFLCAFGQPPQVEQSHPQEHLPLFLSLTSLRIISTTMASIIADTRIVSPFAFRKVSIFLPLNIL